MNDKVSLNDFVKITNCWYSNSTPPYNCVVLGCEILQMSFKYTSVLVAKEEPEGFRRFLNRFAFSRVSFLASVKQCCKREPT